MKNCKISLTGRRKKFDASGKTGIVGWGKRKKETSTNAEKKKRKNSSWGGTGKNCSPPTGCPGAKSVGPNVGTTKSSGEQVEGSTGNGVGRVRIHAINTLPENGEKEMQSSCKKSSRKGGPARDCWRKGTMEMSRRTGRGDKRGRKGKDKGGTVGNRG